MNRLKLWTQTLRAQKTSYFTATYQKHSMTIPQLYNIKYRDGGFRALKDDVVGHVD